MSTRFFTNRRDNTLLEKFAGVFANNPNLFTIPQASLRPDGWQLERKAVVDLLDKLRASGKPLGDYVEGRFYYGIKTGLNEAFVVDRATRDQLIAEHPSSAEILKPFLRGRDVKRWQCQSKDLWLIFTRRGIDIEQYPAIHKHLKPFHKQLVPGGKGGRKPGSYKWYEIQDNIAYWKEFEQVKIVIPAIDIKANYTYDNSGYFSNDKTSICLPDNPKFVLALLNSSVLEWLIKQTAASRQGGYYEFKPMYVSQLPIPDATPEQQALIAALVDRILVAKAADPAADVSALESEIDHLVHTLYHLTPEEIEIVEGRSSP